MVAILISDPRIDPQRVFSPERSEIAALCGQMVGKDRGTLVIFNGKDLGPPLRKAAKRVGMLRRVLVMAHGPLDTSSWRRADFIPVREKGCFYFVSCNSMAAACKIASLAKRVAFGMTGGIYCRDAFLGMEKGEKMPQLYCITPETGESWSRKVEPTKDGRVQISAPLMPFSALASLALRSIEGDRQAALYFLRMSGNRKKEQQIRLELARAGDLSAQEHLLSFAVTPEEKKEAFPWASAAAIKGSAIALGKIGLFYLDQDPQEALRLVECARGRGVSGFDGKLAQHFYWHPTAEQDLAWVIGRLELAIALGDQGLRLPHARLLEQAGRIEEADAALERILDEEEDDVVAEQAKLDLVRIRWHSSRFWVFETLQGYPDLLDRFQRDLSPPEISFDPFDVKREKEDSLYSQILREAPIRDKVQVLAVDACWGDRRAAFALSNIYREGRPGFPPDSYWADFYESFANSEEDHA